MKGIVIQSNNNRSVVLYENGIFREESGKYKAGQTIKTRKPVFGGIQKFAAAAAAAVLITLTGSGYVMTAQAYSYVTIDVNPSIELTLNRFNKVIRAEALNEDADEIIEQLRDRKYRFKTIEDVLSESESILNERGYLSEQDDYMLINIVSRDDRHTEAIKNDLDRYMKKNKSGNDIVEITHATMKERMQARKNGMSTGRFQKMEDMTGERPLRPEEFRDIPVQEIMKP